MEDIKMLQKMANTLRVLALDMIESANSGHPGAPLGLADIAVMLHYHLKHNPKNPKWLNRDRLIFSGGHLSSMIYALLYLWGYDISLDDLKAFRKLGSKTPGHPEFGHTPGLEVTTGPLGQGLANAIGFAMAAKYAANLLNRENAEIITHKVYCICGDGDIQEGISYEACSLAGHLGLDNLIVIYDSNDITIEGKTSLAFSEDVKKRFEAQNWEVIEIDGHNYKQIDDALNSAKSATKPCLIIAKTVIAKGSPNLEGSHETHGAPLGKEEVRAIKERFGFDPDINFFVPEDVLFRFRYALELGELYEKEWNHLLLELPCKEQNELLNRLLNPDFSNITYPTFKTGDMVATRDSNGLILNAISKALPGFIGGSADLAPSNKSELKGAGDFPKGKNIHYGIREHAMAAISNGIALYGLFIPFNATFFVFSDYMTPACRMSAMMNLRHFFIWTHDSIGVGEDGATHQPIEHLMQSRALPNFYTFRPADANENVECWKVALNLNATCGFVLSRQKLKVLEYKPIVGDVTHGGYLVKKVDDPKVTILSSGSELELCLRAANELEKDGIGTNVVSVPCYELFIKQSKEYLKSIIDPTTKVLAVEASRGLEWYKLADDVLGIDTFGMSAPGDELFKYFGFSVDGIIKRVKALILS